MSHNFPLKNQSVSIRNLSKSFSDNFILIDKCNIIQHDFQYLILSGFVGRNLILPYEPLSDEDT